MEKINRKYHSRSKATRSGWPLLCSSDCVNCQQWITL